MRISRRLLLAATLTTTAAFAAQQSGPVAHIQAPPPNASGTLTPDGAVRVSGGIMAGQLIKHALPTLPCGAPHGAVVMHAIIGTDGRVEKLTLISGPPISNEAVMDAVRQWEYKPYLLNGNPVRVDTTVVTFAHGNANACPS